LATACFTAGFAEGFAGEGLAAGFRAGLFFGEVFAAEVFAVEAFAVELFAAAAFAFATVWPARFSVNESIVLVAGGTVVSGRGVVVLTAMDSTAMEAALKVMRKNPYCESL
jgi:hypothetical protein